MPVLETDFLKGIIDPEDELHAHAMKAFNRARVGGWSVASSSFWELDIVMKNNRVDDRERFEIFTALSAEVPNTMVATVTPSSLAATAHLQETYRGIRSFYFDSIHIAVAIHTDGVIVSSDTSFDRVKEVERISLESL